jgi:hypothetical protein
MRLATKTMTLPMTSDTVGRTLKLSGQSGSMNSCATCVLSYTRNVLPATPRTVRPIRSASTVTPARALSTMVTVRILDWRWRSWDSASKEDADPWERLLFSMFYIGFLGVLTTSTARARREGGIKTRNEDERWCNTKRSEEDQQNRTR